MMVSVSTRGLFASLLWVIISFFSTVYGQCPQGDLNRDCRVDMEDLEIISHLWMTQNPAAQIDDNTQVNFGDFGVLAGNWLEEGSILIISEFLASNGNIYLDEDGDSSDWIEIYNPTSIPVSLEGWYLTNDIDDLDRWRFPKVTIEPESFLVVYASQKDRRNPDSQLHTDFNLNAEGDFLALVKPDAESIAFSFDPEFPPQFRDVSYGISQITNLAKLVSRKSQGKLLVPETQSELDIDWTKTNFDDDAWQDVTLGIGFDTSLGGSQDVEEVAASKSTQQSSIGFGYGSELAVDGDLNTFTHTLNTDENATWQVDLDGTYFISKIVLHNRHNCCQSRLRDITITIRDPGDTVDTFVSDLINPENVLMSPTIITIDLMELTGTAIYGGIVKVSRTPDPDLSGSDGQGNIDEAMVLSLGEVEVFASQTPNAYSEIFETNIFDQMVDKNASAYVRIPFQLPEIHNFSNLNLNIRYDDGFVAYLNGTEVARFNAPDNIDWNSSAVVERSKDLTVTVKTVNLTDYFYLLNEGENLLAFQALNFNALDEDFLLDVELTANDNILGALSYMKEPSPGKLNNQGLPGVVSDTRFSHDRGFYDQAFDVEITTETPGATIVYTTNNSEPTLDNGTKILAGDDQTPPAGTVNISKTTVLRAAAFRDDYQPTNTDTQTYIFLDGVIASSVMSTSITQDPQYASQMRQALTDLPTISIVDPSNHLTQVVRTGPYPQWTYDEFPISMEWLTPDGSLTFQEDAGAGRYGGHWYDRSGSTYPWEKWSYRIAFRKEYGAAVLKAPLFEGFDNGIPPAETFDQLEIRSGSHDMDQRGFYMSGALTADTMLEMGNINPHSRFVHVYINGTYWGQYNLHERFNAFMVSRYAGGDKEDYEAVKANNSGGDFATAEPYDGDGTVWNNALTFRNSYEDLKTWVDIQSYVDFMLMFLFGNSESEFRAAGSKSEDGIGFQFWLRDPDGFTRSSSRTNNNGPGNIFSSLLSQAHPDFMTFLADRIHQHFFDGGGLTQEAMTAKLLNRCDEVEVAFLAEAARWGYRSPSSWASARDSYINSVLSTRPQTLFDSLKNAGFYPSTIAPIFNINNKYKHGGYVSSGDQFSMEMSDSSSYTNIDLVPESAPVRIYFPSDNSLGTSWTQRYYVPGAGWSDGSTTTGVGYERGSGYQDWIGTDVEADMYGNKMSVFCRIEFDYDDSQILDELQLLMRFDDAFVAYLNGTELGRSNNITNDIPNFTQVGNHEASQTYEKINIISNALDLLVPGNNILAIHGINAGYTSSDMIVLPKLIGRKKDVTPGPLPILFTVDGSDPRLPGGNKNQNAQNYSGQFAITNSIHVKSRTRIDGQWSALNEAVFAVGPVAENLRVTEVMYHPADPNHEYIELQNVGSESINLNLVRLTKGVDFTFGSIDLSPDEFVLVVNNQTQFLLKYPDFSGTIAGQFEGNLNNNGEKIRIKDALDETFIEFDYQDGWYDITDGAGFSLTIKDALGTDPYEWDSKSAWRPSAAVGGSPGFEDSGLIPPLGSVVINEVLAHSHAIDPDWIELHNTTDADVNIGGWFLSDSNNDLMKYEIAEGVSIPANGYIVFYEDSHFGNPEDPGCTVPFALNENGDDVYLHSGQNGELTGYNEEEDFGASETGVSMGRYQKSTGTYNFISMSSPTREQENSYPKVGPVVITEIMYHPAGDADAEYVEIMNIENYQVKLYDELTGESWKLEDDGGFELFIPYGTTISPGERIILTKDETPLAGEFTDIPAGTKIFEWESGSLSNGSEKIQLSKPGDVDETGKRYYIRVDRIIYDDNNGWPTDPDGTGKSLERINNNEYGNDIVNWQSSAASPGR